MPDPTAPSAMAQFARRHDPDRFLCALFAPAPRREALFALIAYNHELARAREAARNPLAALLRLQWWRDAVAAAAAGKPPLRHEVAAPLHAAILAGDLSPEDLTAMADAREAEAEEEGIPGRAAFDAYLRGTAGGFAVAAGRLLGAPAASLPALQQAGALYGLAGVLRSLPALAAQGTLPPLAITLAGIGEEGGRLREMLQEAAVIHEDALDRATERLVALLLPGVTLLLGVLVGGIVLATLEAILGANSAALGAR
ncbi:squalene/phytoene synthase family protein [Paracraurococcus ruber]|uniref:Phytoene synthase n=1 Tax=Paracraurococcus ruber TaxID=77675 RepID=A0ABS1D3R1_9PROT|nr:squalene/phytoene synthase family protein [Paracraurococcus ruber]MBK1661128.1 hypothetical protein [Paracraurococcus ruber]